MRLLKKVKNNITPEFFYSQYFDLPKNKTEVKVECCFHQDNDPSLSINLKTGLYHCFGCKSSGDIIDFYQKKNKLNFKEAIKQLAEEYHIEVECKDEIYTYKDEKGNDLFQYVRVDGDKNNAYYRRRKDGEWVNNIKGVERVPYNLDKVVDSELVIVVEGEKDVENLRRYKLTATCNPFGAGKWSKKYNKWFKDKKTVVIPDNDREGKRHAEDVIDNLRRVTDKIKYLELPDLEEKEDVTDYLSKNSPEDLKEKMKSCELVEFDDGLPKPNKLFDRFLNRLEAKSKRDGEPEFTTSIDVLDELTGGFQRGYITIVAGTPGSGKTSLVSQMALINADNPDNNVLLLTLDQDSVTLTGRLFCNHCEIHNRALKTGMFEEKDVNQRKKLFKKYLRGTNMKLVEKGYNFDEIVEIIEKGYKDVKPDLLLIDHIQLIKWGKYTSQNSAIMHYMRDLTQLAREHHIAIVVCSQIRREGVKRGKKPTMFDLYGSGSIEQDANTIIILYQSEVETFGGNEETQTFVSLEKNRLGEKRESIPVNFIGKYYKFKSVNEEVMV